MSQESVSQIVKRIIDQLSDGVSELILFVVVLAEQNAEVPDHLPGAAGLVIQTAGVLSGIADQLASSNYSDFPEIAKGIVTAGANVRKANEELESSIQELLTQSDRKKGWSGLVSSCRVMSGNTIKLLTTVYGADFKRLNVAFDRVKDAVDEFDGSTLKENPQQYVDDASKIGTQVAQLAQYMMAKAADEESPYAREKLSEEAQQVHQKANDFIQAINSSLQNPDDVNATQKPSQILKEIKDIVNDAQELSTSSAKAQGIQLEDSDDDVIQKVDKVDQERVEVEETYSPLENAVRNAVDLVDEMNKSEDEQILAVNASKTKIALDALKANARNIDDENVTAVIGIIERVYPQAVLSAKARIVEPSAVNKKHAADQSDLLKSAVSDLEEMTQDNELGKLLLDLDDLLDDTNASALQGNPQKNVKKLEVLKKKVAALGTKQARENLNPSQEKQIQDTLDSINDALGELIDDLKEENVKTIPSDVNRVRDAVSALREISGSGIIPELKDLKNTGDVLALRSKTNDVKEVDNGNQKLRQKAKDVSDALRKYSQNPHTDPSQQEALLDSAHEVENAVNNLSEAAERTVLNPDNRRTTKKLDRTLDDLDNAVAQAINAVKNRPVTKAKLKKSDLDEGLENLKKLSDDLEDFSSNDPDSVPTVVIQMKKIIDALEDGLEKETSKFVDPKKKKNLHDSFDRIKETFPQEVDAAVKYIQEPGNMKKENLTDSHTALRAAIDDFADAATPTAKDNLENLKYKIENLSPDSEAELFDDIDDLMNQIKNNAVYAANIKDAISGKDDILDTLNDFYELLDDILEEAEDGSINPKKIFTFSSVLDNLTDLTNANVLDKIEELRKAKDELVRASKVRNTEHFTQVRNKTDDLVDDVIELVRIEIRNLESPDQKQKISKRAQKLEDFLEDLQDVTAEQFSGSDKADEVNDASQKVDKILTALSDAILGAQKDAYKDDVLSNLEKGSPLSKLIKKAKKKLDDLVNASVVDPQLIPATVKELKDLLDQLREEVLDLSKKNPKQEDDLINGINAVTQQFADVVKSIQSLLQDPDSILKKARLLKESNKMKDALDDLDNAAGRNPTLEEIIDSVKYNVIELENAKKQGDSSAVNQAKKHIDDLYEDLKSKAGDAVKLNSDIKKRNKIKKNLLDLEDSFDALSRDITGNKSADAMEDNLKSLIEDLDDLKKNTTAEATSCVEKVRQYADAANHSAERADVNGVANNGKKVIAATQELLDKLNDVIDDQNVPARNRNELAALKEPVQEAVAELVRASQKSAQDPENTQDRNDLEEAHDYLNSILEEMEDLLKNSKNAQTADDSPIKDLVYEAKNTLADSIDIVEHKPKKAKAQVLGGMNLVDAILARAKKVGDAEDDKEKAARIENASISLKTAIEELPIILDQLAENQDDKQAKKQIDELLDLVNSQLDSLEALTRPGTLDEELGKLRDEANELRNSKGNMDKSKIIVSEMLATNKKVRAHIADLTELIEDDDKNDRLKAAANNVDRILRKLDDKVNSDSEDYLKNLDDILSDLEDAIDELQKEVVAEVLGAITKVDGDLDQLSRAAQYKELDFDGALDDINRDMAALEAALDRANEANIKNTEKMNDLHGRMKNKVSEKINTAQSVKNNPGDETLLANLKKENVHAHNLLNKMRDLLDVGDAKKEIYDSDSDYSYSYSLTSDSDDDIRAKVQVDEDFQVTSPIKNELVRLNAVLDRIAEAASKGDPESVQANAQKLREELNDLKTKVGGIIDQTIDPKQKDIIQNALDQVENSIPIAAAAAKKLLDHPEDKEAKIILDMSICDAKETVRNLEEATIPSLNGLTDQVKRALDELCDAQKKNKKEAAKEALKEVSQKGNELLNRAVSERNEKVGDDQLDLLDNLLSDLEKGIQNVEDDAEKNSDKLEEDVEKLKNVIDDLSDKLNSKPLSVIDYLRADSSALNNSSKQGDANSVKENAHKLIEDNDLLKNLLKDQPQEDQEQLKNALDDVEGAIGNIISVNKKLLENPENMNTRATVDSAKDDLGRTLDDLDTLLQKKNAQSKEQRELGKKIKNISKDIPNFDIALQKLHDNPEDKKSQKVVKDLATKLAKRAEDLNSSITDPEDRIVMKKNQIQDSMDNILDAVKSDNPDLFIAPLKVIKKNSEDFVDELRSYGERLPDDQRERLEDKITEFQRKVAPVLSSTRAVAKDLDNSSKKENLYDDISKLKKALKRAEGIAIPPKDRDEKTIRDAGDRIKENIDDLINNAKKGYGVEDSLKNINQDFPQLKRAANRRLNQLPQENDNSMSELQSLWKKFNINARKVADDPSKEKQAEVEDIGNSLKAIIDDINVKTKATPIAQIEDVEDAIDDLVDSLEDRDLSNVSAQANNIIAKYNVVSGLVNTLEPEKRNKAVDVLQPAPGYINEMMAKVKEIASQGTPEIETLKELNSAAIKMKEPLNQLKKIIDPESKDRSTEADISKLKKLLDELDNDPNKNDLLKNDIKHSLEDISMDLKSVVDNESDIIKKQAIDDNLAKLDNILLNFDENISNNPHLVVADLNNLLDNLLGDVKGDGLDAMINNGAKLSNLAASISLGGFDLDAGLIFGAANDLSDALNNLIGNAKFHAKGLGDTQNLSRAARAALDLTGLLSGLDNLETSKKPDSLDLDALMDAIDDLSQPVLAPVKVEITANVSSTVPNITTLEENAPLENVLDSVADDIDAALGTNDRFFDSSLSQELRRLARSARMGQKETLLISGRSCANSLKILMEKLREVAASIPGNNIREKMMQQDIIRYAQALENYGTQLKILSSVKAASVEADHDTDESMASITKTIGIVIRDAVRDVEVVEKTILSKYE